MTRTKYDFEDGIFTKTDTQTNPFLPNVGKELRLSCFGVGDVININTFCTNIAEDFADVDQFVCSRCGIHLQDWTRVEIDEDTGDETHYEYVMRYCPNCGAKIQEEHE